MPITVDPSLAGTEQVTLDPVEVAPDRFELVITDYLKHEGIDWGTAEIQAYMADQERGSSPVDFRLPNRTVTIPLQAIEESGGPAFNEIRAWLQAKAALFQRKGGWLKRELADGSIYYLDIVNATFKLGGSTFAALERWDTDIELVLECLPDFYGDEISLDLITESSAAEIVEVLELSASTAQIKGDYPGRCRIVVTDAQGQDQLGLIWGFRCEHYDSGAPLVYEAEALANMDTAADAALTGASGGNVVRHSNLGATWTPVCFGAGTHIGTYRVWARVYTSTDPATAEVKCRLVSDVGDLTNPTENTPFTVPGASQFYLADLGEIRIDEAQVGAHYAIFMIQAKGEAGGEDFRIDRLWLQPVDEFAGRLSAPVTISDGLTTFSARDEFNQGAAALSGLTLPVGGTWAGAGDADVFSVTGVGGTPQFVAQRTAVSDADENTGRYAIAGSTNYTSLVVQADVRRSVALDDAAASFNLYQGVFARYADTSNWLMATVVGGVGGERVLVRKRVAGTVTTLASAPVQTVGADAWHTIGLMVLATGTWTVTFDDRDVLSGGDSALATGGALATGKPGLYDARIGTGANTRSYDNFVAWVPPRDAVAFASQSVELQTQGMYREDSAGTTSGPVPKVIGDLPRIPPSGLENLPVEVFAKLSRGDLDQLPDSAIDDLTLRVHYRPSHLLLPVA